MQNAPFWPDPAMRALCERLGIDVTSIESSFHSSHSKPLPVSPLELNKLIWVQIGRELSRTQPEFRGKSSRGRPKVGNAGVDYERYRQLRAYVSKNGLTLGRDITYAEAIDDAMDVSLSLFAGESRDSYIASVSRGKKVWEEAFQELMRFRVEGIRQSIRELRMRKIWLDERETDLERLEELSRSALMPLLDVESYLEKSEIILRLRNPFPKW